jgi:hypothetical protein
MVRLRHSEAQPQFFYFKQVFPAVAADLCRETAPKEFCDVLDEHGDLLNIPSVGKTFQHFFSNVQVNISPAAAKSDDRECFQTSLGSPQCTYTKRSDDIQGGSWTVCSCSPRQEGRRRCTYGNGISVMRSTKLPSRHLRIPRFQDVHPTH